MKRSIWAYAAGMMTVLLCAHGGLANAAEVAGAPASAAAQSMQETQGSQEPQAAPAQPPRATDLDTVIVTVERREQDLQRYAGTAQAFTAEDLRALGINNELRNIQVAIPGMSIANQEGNVEIFIRGVGSANNTELGDPGAAPHLNGNYIPRPRGLGTMFYDLERVEINKGPQGTLRGRNAVAGTMNIVTRRPQLGEDAATGYVQGEVGNRDHRGGEVALNMPLAVNAALRFAGYHVEKGSSFTNVGDPRLTPAGIQNETAGRLSFLYEPDDKLSVFAMVDMGHESGTGYPGANIYSAVRAGFGPDDVDMREVVYRGRQGEMDNRVWGFQGNVGYDFGAISLEYNGSYRDVDFWQRNATSDSINWPGRDLSAVDYDVFSSQFWQTRSQAQTHELRFVSTEGERFNWTAGGFYFHEKQQVGFFSVADKGYCCYSGTEFTMPDVDGKSWAVFGDGTFDVSDNFRLKGGLRYTDESKSRYGIGGNWALTLGGADFACCFATRLGTEGFVPTLLDRPSFDVSGLSSSADFARFLLQGILTPGARDTLIQQIGGIADGTAPNGTCFVRPDIDNGFMQCPPGGGFSYANLTIPSQQRGSSAFDYVDWRFGFEWDRTDRSLVYGTLSTAHKAGGFNDSFDPDVIPETYRPEKILALELGTKNRFDMFGRPATFNIAAFFYNYTDQVFQDLTAISFDPVTEEASGFALANRNVGKSRIYGVEADSTLRFEHGFSLNLNALYLDTEIRQGVVADARSQNFDAGGITSEIDLSGNELPLASRLTFNARLQQLFDVSFGTFDWQILAAYRSSFYLTQFNNREVTFVDITGATVRVEDAFTAGFPDQQRGVTQINVGAGFTSPDGAWRTEIWGANLLDKDVSQKALVGSGLNIRFLNDARSYGVRVRYQF
jgi:iron complex outermembrane recepter protein